MKKIKADGIVFSLGAAGYSAIELLWRGRTHWSMMLAGGVCFLGFARIGDYLMEQKLIRRCVIGSGIITAVELVFGIIFNLWLKLGVWDYSTLPFNFLGQICLLYSALWGLLSIPFMPLADGLYKKMLNS